MLKQVMIEGFEEAIAKICLHFTIAEICLHYDQ